MKDLKAKEYISNKLGEIILVIANKKADREVYKRIMMHIIRLKVLWKF